MTACESHHAHLMCKLRRHLRGLPAHAADAPARTHSYATTVLSGFVALALLAAAPAHAERIIGDARVVDGDTLEVSGTRIRLFGIDAPESKQQCANASKQQYACGATPKLAMPAAACQRRAVRHPAPMQMLHRVVV